MTFATRFCAPTPWTEVDGWFAPAFFFWWGTLFSQLFGCFFAWRVNKMVQMQDVRPRRAPAGGTAEKRSETPLNTSDKIRKQWKQSEYHQVA